MKPEYEKLLHNHLRLKHRAVVPRSQPMTEAEKAAIDENRRASAAIEMIMIQMELRKVHALEKIASELALMRCRTGT